MKDKSNSQSLFTYLTSFLQQNYSVVRLLFYTGIIFAAHISSALLTQKIYKTPYMRNDEKYQQTKSDYFDNPFAIPLVTTFLALFYNSVKQQLISPVDLSVELPVKTVLRLSVVQVATVVLLHFGIILTSFTTINLINSCNLLAVVVFAILSNKILTNRNGSGDVRTQNKIGIRQVSVSVLICCGVLIFNGFKNDFGGDSINKSLTIWSALLIVFVLILQGYRPQLLTQVKQQYSPSPSLLYYEISKYSFLVTLLLSVFTLKLPSFLIFLWSHDRLALDLMLHGALDVIGTIFIYRIVVIHRQHIVPIILTIRKLLTSVINLAYFSSGINLGEYFGIGLVFAAVGLEMWMGYQEKLRKFKSIEAEQAKFGTV